MKRLTTLLAAVILSTMLCLFLVACGSSEPAQSPESGAPAATEGSAAQPEGPAAPPTDGAGITTNALINETWEWIDSIEWDDRKVQVTYDEVASRLGDDGEWIDTDTNADKGAIHFRWNDPDGGVIRIEFRPTEDGIYTWAQGNTSGTN